MEDKEKNSDFKKELSGLIANWKREIEGVDKKEVNYYLAWYGKTSKKNKLNIKRMKMDATVGEVFLNILKGQIYNIDPTQMVKYFDDDSMEHEGYAVEDTSKIPNFDEALSRLPLINDQWKVDDEKNENITGLKFILQAGKFSAFGNVTKRKEIKTSGKISMIFTQARVFKKIESQEIIYDLPEEFPAISFDGKVLIKSEKAFEDIFKYNERLLSKVEAKKEFNESIFTDPDDYINSLRNSNIKARKVITSYENSVIDLITPESIKKYKAEYKNIEVILDDNTGKIIFSRSNQWDVVHLICEDYFKGFFSKFDMVARQKTKK